MQLRWLPDAQRYETGSLAYALFHAWTAGLELLLEIGVPAIQARVLASPPGSSTGFGPRA